MGKGRQEFHRPAGCRRAAQVSGSRGCTKNPSSVEVKNYFCIKIENSENDILLTKNEVNLLLKYRSAGEAERKLAHEALDFTER